MNIVSKCRVLAAALLALTASSSAMAQIDIMVGDNDGFGFGAAAVPDNAPMLNINLPEDRRSGAEMAAINGAQQTDFYSALYTPLDFSFSALFPLANPITSGILTIDMGGFQASTFGQFSVAFNGVAQPGLFNFEDGVFETAVRTFNLSPTAIANANAAGQFTLDIARNGSNDAVSFDYFRLEATVAPVAVPEPGNVALLAGLAVPGMLCVRRMRRR